MDTAQGPRRWAQHLMEWSCEAMRLAYPKDEYKRRIKEAIDNYFAAGHL